jgi:hypothetical protein
MGKRKKRVTKKTARKRAPSDRARKKHAEPSSTPSEVRDRMKGL